MLIATRAFALIHRGRMFSFDLIHRGLLELRAFALIHRGRMFSVRTASEHAAGGLLVVEIRARGGALAGTWKWQRPLSVRVL